jgi:hypothetical protein
MNESFERKFSNTFKYFDSLNSFKCKLNKINHFNLNQMKSFYKFKFIEKNGPHCEIGISGCGSAVHQSPPWAPLPIQVIQGNVEFEQIQMQDWEDEPFDDEVEEEEELARVQQEIERLHQEQKAITCRQATT